jgi:hypothetical protein
MSGFIFFDNGRLRYAPFWSLFPLRLIYGGKRLEISLKGGEYSEPRWAGNL